MHSFLKKTLSLSLALSLLAGAASAATLTGLETETVERSWESSLFFPRMEALTGVSMEAHAVSDETQYAAMLDAMGQGDIPADVLFKANLTRAQEQALLNGGALIDLAPLIEANMPNLSALLAAHPDWKAAICLEDGPYRLPAAAEYDGASGLRVDQRQMAFCAEPVRTDIGRRID